MMVILLFKVLYIAAGILGCIMIAKISYDSDPIRMMEKRQEEERNRMGLGEN